MKAPRPSMYQRPSKPLFVAVPQQDHTARTVTAAPLPAPVSVDRSSECHVTPPDVAARMAALLGPLHGVDVLEPSAGTGNLARAVLAAGCEPGRLVMVEKHTRLADGLHSIGGSVDNCGFLEYATTAGTFGAILMNPPFSRVRAHVAAAASLLEDGGTLVALVPVTFDAAGFQTVEQLPATTFQMASVSTKVVRFRR